MTAGMYSTGRLMTSPVSGDGFMAKDVVGRLGTAQARLMSGAVVEQVVERRQAVDARVVGDGDVGLGPLCCSGRAEIDAHKIPLATDVDVQSFCLFIRSVSLCRQFLLYKSL